MGKLWKVADERMKFWRSRE